MARDEALTSPNGGKARLTHLLWDETPVSVLDSHASPARSAGLGEYRMNFRKFRLAVAALAPAALMFCVSQAFLAGQVLAQAPSPTPSPEVSASPSPAPVASPAPAPAASASPAPAASPTPAASASPAPSASPAAPPAAAQNPPSAANVQAADPFGQEIKLETKKVVIVKGSANWDAAFDTLVESLKSLTAMLDKQGIKPSGNPLIVYTSTDDTGFTFLAEIPVDQEPKNLPKAMSMGQSPEGRALKFVHRGSYDNMDNTYEAITNHLDEKKLEAKDTFIEEYLTDPIKTAEDKLVINVYVPLK
jgi:effector-binding domain-containing protein